MSPPYIKPPKHCDFCRQSKEFTTSLYTPEFESDNGDTVTDQRWTICAECLRKYLEEADPFQEVVQFDVDDVVANRNKRIWREKA